MIDGKRVLAVIPARGGSKGIPRKNIRDVAGRPLIAWTVCAARGSRYVDRLILSSEDPEIIAVAKREGCEAPFVRPAALATDDSPGIAPVLHALESIPGFDYVVLLQPTSPLRLAEDIDGCIAACHLREAPSCVSVSEPAHHPYWTFSLDAAGALKPLFENPPSRRQDLPLVYAVNGAVYVAEVGALLQSGDFLQPGVVPYVMPPLRALDIDTPADLELAECLLGRMNRQL